MSRLTAPNASERVIHASGWFAETWFRWVSRVTALVSGKEPIPLASYTEARKPLASDWPQCVIFNSDTGGAEVSDGTNWIEIKGEGDQITLSLSLVVNGDVVAGDLVDSLAAQLSELLSRR